MARYTDNSCRICRRENQKLFLKGARCYSDKCALSRRAFGPGQHGQKRKKLSEYGMQLREKQKTKSFYGILESQFKKYFLMATKRKGVSGENLLQILESRFDNVIYRLGFANSRYQARMLVRHGHFEVNGQKVNIPSYLVKVGDIITLKESSKQSQIFKENIAINAKKAMPSWLEADIENYTGKVVSLSSRDEVDLPVEEHLIVELYSK
ncbi:MAG: 30S ribosomal protein S4 [Clostridia bacterium]|nr:30S ribosomal protein S4 [Clostridia bacterium]